VIGDDRVNSVYAFLRHGAWGEPSALVVCNFTPVPRHGYRIGVPAGGQWTERINTDSPVYGGSGVCNGTLSAEPVPSHGRGDSLSLSLPPLGTVILLAAGG
jgi:1,4-alpha-glucan branching enzyme